MITREEYGLLKYCRAKGYKWIARDKNKMLYVYSHKPFKENSTRYTSNEETSYNYISYSCHNDTFKSITWEDEEPTKINDLIRDYESHQIITSEKVKVTVPKFVADWIEEVKGTCTLKWLFTDSNMPSSVEDWLYGNNEKCELMALAWIYGYEVEKEKLYTVRLAKGNCLYRYVSVGIDWIKGPSDYRNDKDFQLTQSEIESVDPILMKIAEEVE